MVPAAEHRTVDNVSDLVWYASYGSNMSARRFSCYLQGGNLPGMQRVYPGARDQSPPRASRPVWLGGAVYFALESKVWTGGMAFLDPDASGCAAGRAYLITVEQFADVVAQETHALPGSVDVNVSAAVASGRVTLGPGRYETLVVAGHVENVPVLTFTSPNRQHPVTPPSPAYLRMLAQGLIEAHGWDMGETARYLSALEGADRLGLAAVETMLTG